MKFRRMITLLLAMILSFGAMAPASAVNASDAMDSTAATLLKAAAELRTGDTGGEWVVLGLARSGCAVPESYLAADYRNLEDYVKACGGVLHKRKYTEYSRVILALTAIGKDPTNVAGYDLTEPLNDFDRTVWQGINGASWALLALDSGNYDNDQRQAYIDHILSLEISGGGWALTGSAADVDITAMVLQALAKYQDQKAVKEATDRALVWLSDVQNSDGTFSTLGDATCESTAQVVVALCELGIEPEDSRFVKSGKSALDGLLHYYVGGGFEHISGCGKNDMATEQGFYAMVAADRAAKGQSSLYRIVGGTPAVSGAGDASFPDVEGHKNRKAIDALVAKQIINGMGDGTFSPGKTMTRAQFCTITVKALGLTPKAAGAFTDVPSGQWYAGYVGTASSHGIVNGIGGNKFNPNGTITRQEAAAMVARAARIIGLDTSVEDADEILLLFSDGGSVASWARESVAWCYESGILEDKGTIQPAKAILRCEIAQMIYNMLDAAGKI